MLNLSFDFEALTMLASMSGVHLSADHARVYAAIEDLDRRGRERGRPIAMVYLVARDNVAPDAHWRRRFAEQRKTFGSPHVYLSIVSQSPVIRGVLTAMNWIAPQPPHMTSTTHRTQPGDLPGRLARASHRRPIERPKIGRFDTLAAEAELPP
jgi:hypothetical protein